jgi:hypothetical protein
VPQAKCVAGSGAQSEEVTLQKQVEIPAFDRALDPSESRVSRAVILVLVPSLPSTGMLRGSKTSGEPIALKSRIKLSLK